RLDSAGDGRGRASRGSGGRPGGVERVPRRPEDAVGRVRSGREFGHVRLARGDHACRLQPSDDGAGPLRHMVGEELAAVGRAHTCGVMRVLVGHGHSVEWRQALFTGRTPPVRLTRRGERAFGFERDDRVRRWVDLGDAVEVRGHELDAADLSAVESGRLLGQGQPRRRLRRQRRPARRPRQTPSSAAPAPTAAPTTKPSPQDRWLRAAQAAGTAASAGADETAGAPAATVPDATGAAAPEPESPSASAPIEAPAGTPFSGTPSRMAASMSAKNFFAMRLATPPSIRCPTPPIGPPSTASASQVMSLPPSAPGASATEMSASIVPGPPAPLALSTNDVPSTSSENATVPL